MGEQSRRSIGLAVDTFILSKVDEGLRSGACIRKMSGQSGCGTRSNANSVAARSIFSKRGEFGLRTKCP